MISNSHSEYDLMARIAVRLASCISSAIQQQGLADEAQAMLIFDALADGLVNRTEDELLSLISVGGHHG